MAEKAAPKKRSEKSTKQELLESYTPLLEEMEQRRASELNPAKRLEERKADEAVKVAEGIGAEGMDRAIGALKSEIASALGEIGEKLTAEAVRFRSVQKAIEAKERELQELYGIEKAAAGLAALLEAQNQKRREFEAELATQKEQLEREIESTRSLWEEEKRRRDQEAKERELAEKKQRDREKEDFVYGFRREQQGLRDKLNDEKATLEKEILTKREAAEKEFTAREKAIAEHEQELAQLRQRAAAFPKELETTVDKAVKDLADRLKAEAKAREDLLRKEHEGERNVLAARIEALDRLVKDLTTQNAKLANQAEAAYQKVQEIAEKAIDGSSQAKSYVELQKMLADQRKPASEKS
jgi:hypothetical protein